MTITINAPETILYLLVILIALYAVDLTLILVGKYLKWRIKRIREQSKKLR